MLKARIVLTLAATGILAVALASRADAQKIKADPIKPLDNVSGSVTFKAYCAQCHGVGGRGNGPAAKALKVAPADLTTIAKRNGGKFPVASVRAIISGEHEMPAHGSREMPMWGPVLRSVEAPPIAELRIANLINHLQQIQEK